jgi:hypothetical protein
VTSVVVAAAVVVVVSVTYSRNSQNHLTGEEVRLDDIVALSVLRWTGRKERWLGRV